MEIAEECSSLRQQEALPSVIRVTEFDSIKEFSVDPNDPIGYKKRYSASARESGESAAATIESIGYGKVESVSISMPPAPTGRHLQNANLSADQTPPLETQTTGQSKSPRRPAFGKDARFASFKTKTPRQELNTPSLRRLQRSHHVGNNALPADRYFDALQGPDLDTLKPHEESMLPDDNSWPFLLRYTVSTFGICLGVSSQAVLWKTLATSVSTNFLHISLRVNLVLWIISLTLVVIVSSLYLLKLIFYFEAVRREYYHPIRVNFFFAPWISLLFLCLGLPPSISKTLPRPLWYVLMVPIFCLEVKIYGQWMSGGRRRLSKVANPANHLSVVGNFVGALLGATMGLKEPALFFLAVGLAHYTVLFVTLYQRLPTNETLPKELHPVFFLFVAGPSVASMAWAAINGSFDNVSKLSYFISLFLYLSLAARVNFFRGFKFSLTWWAYTFPMTGAAIATIRYSNEVKHWFTQALSVTLCVVSVIIVTALLVITIIHAFVLRDLYPNDIAIAITETPPRKRWFHDENGNSHPDDVETLFNFLSVNRKEAHRSNSDSSNG